MGRLIQADWHVHTALSDCGSPEATPEAMIAAAKAAGLAAIGFADHVITPGHRTRPSVLRAQLPENTEGVTIFVSCEADMLSPARCSIDWELAAGLDYVIMAASHLYLPEVEKSGSLNPRSTAELIVQLTLAAIGAGLADIIAHPFGVPESPFTWPEIVGEVRREELVRIGETARKAGVAVECNPRYLRQAPDAATWLFGTLLETGVKLAVNSDAHHPAGVGCRGPGYATEEELRAEGITEDSLWTIEDRVSAGRGRSA